MLAEIGHDSMLRHDQVPNYLLFRSIVIEQKHVFRSHLRIAGRVRKIDDNKGKRAAMYAIVIELKLHARG